MRQPNVLLINCDDMGYGDLSCYGSDCNRTPAIDALAASGMRLTDFYAASPVCSPSRAALMTGCYPPRVGINTVLFPGEAEGLDPSEYTLPRLFHDAGYATAIVGKWHLGDQPGSLPSKFGFDTYFGLPYSNDMGVQKGKTDFKRYPPLPLLRGDEVVEEQPDQCGLTGRYVEECVSFLRNVGDRPFFLYLAQMHVHLPLYADERFVRASRNGDYGACVEEVDWSVDVLMRTLSEMGVSENTIVIFTSDNGSRGDHGASNSPLRGGKHSSWEGGLRVPFLVRWPGRIAPGSVNTNMACNIDLLPTFAAILGVKLPEIPIDGVDISSMWRDANAAARDNMIYYTASRHGSRLCAARMGRWKLHVSRNGEAVRELYDLQNDIGETNNVICEHGEIAQELTALLDRYRRMLGDNATGVAGAEQRPCRVDPDPHALTVYDPGHPYIVAMYDKEDAG